MITGQYANRVARRFVSNMVLTAHAELRTVFPTRAVIKRRERLVTSGERIVHTIDELDTGDFDYRMDGEPVSRTDVIPPLTLADRVGVMMGSGTAGIGAGGFILSCVIAFYDRLEETKAEFFEYPDYYTFQTTTQPADYGMLDIYPGHKNVTVEPDAERLLQAINDRAITVLLVPNEPTRTRDIENITLRSADRRIDHCYLYATDGHLDNAEFAIRHPRRPVEDWYQTTAHSVETVPETYTHPSLDSDDDHIIHEFRRIPLEEALSRLPV